MYSERLRSEREKLGMTQKEFAEAVGVTEMTQNNYERGKRKPDIEYLNKAAELGLDINYIVTGKRQGVLQVDENTSKEHLGILLEKLNEVIQTIAGLLRK